MEPDPGDMYTFFKDSLPDGRTGFLTGTHELRPGDPRVAKRHSCHFCDFLQRTVYYLKKSDFCGNFKGVYHAAEYARGILYLIR